MASDRRESLVLDHIRLPDFDPMLHYASEYMKNLKQLSLQSHHDNNNHDDPVPFVRPGAIRSFVKNMVPRLEILT